MWLWRYFHMRFKTTEFEWSRLLYITWVQFSCSVVFDSFQPHEPQHATPPCPSPTASLLKSIYMESAMPSNHLILCRPASPPALNLSQQQDLFKWISSSHQVAEVLGGSASASALPMNIQDQFPLGLTDLFSLQSKGLSKVFSNTTVQKHQSFGAQLSLWSNSHNHTWLLEKP